MVEQIAVEQIVVEQWKPVAVVTGAASGIGRATTELIAERGGRVVAMDIKPDGLPRHDNVIAFAGDVTSEAANAEAVALAEHTWGRLDVLILNAGVRASGPIDTASLEVFDHSIEVNLRSAVLGMRVGIPAMRRTGGGAVVITASNSGLNGEVNRWQYATAKAGVLNLMRSVALDVAVDNIRVNAVCPGPTLTGMTSDIAVRAPDRYDSLRRAVPQQRWAEPREIAEAIWFLASPAASFITGVALPVDGGVSAHVGQGELPSRAATTH
jgi:meso-butanediol dehydrogenase / (S,S)-butanediol dehydrogenase / diacetyl reductase